MVHETRRQQERKAMLKLIFNMFDPVQKFSVNHSNRLIREFTKHATLGSKYIETYDDFVALCNFLPLNVTWPLCLVL